MMAWSFKMMSYEYQHCGGRSSFWFIIGILSSTVSKQEFQPKTYHWMLFKSRITRPKRQSRLDKQLQKLWWRRVTTMS
jgi:hypothetical protein